MKLITERLMISDLDPSMARAIHLGSLDEDTRRFLPDEVFETEEIAAEVISDLMTCCNGNDGPFVHPMLLPDSTFVGYVQLVPCEESWEVGYHVSAEHRGQGYAAEALAAFLPHMMNRLGLTEAWGICLKENAASVRVLEKCGFHRVFQGNGMYQGQMRPIVKMVYEKVS